MSRPHGLTRQIPFLVKFAVRCDIEDAEDLVFVARRGAERVFVQTRNLADSESAQLVLWITSTQPDSTRASADFMAKPFRTSHNRRHTISHIVRKIFAEIRNAVELPGSESLQIAPSSPSTLRGIEQGRRSADTCANANNSNGFKSPFDRH